MDLPELKLPESVNDLDVSKGTLADEADNYIETEVDGRSIEYSYNDYDSIEQKIDKACKQVNKTYDDHRRSIAELIHQHIISSGGVADSYPSPFSANVFKFRGFDDLNTDHSFNYFKDDYVVDEKGLKCKTEGLVYRNCYEFPGTKEYNELKKKEDKLDEVIKKGEKKGNRPEKIFCILALIFISYCLLAFIFHLVFGTGEEQFDRFINEESFPFAIIYHILKLPIYIAMILRKFNQAGKIIYGIIVCGALLFGIVFLSFGLHDEDDYKECRKAKKKKRELKNTSEYIRITKENNELKQANERLAEQWHQAWFKWYKERYSLWAKLGLE